MRQRIMMTVAVAGLGVTGGLLYARFSGATGDRILSMYGTMGAVIAVLGLRLAAIFRSILSDYFSDQ